MRQSDRGEAYSDALDLLWDRGLLYPCSCSRRDILTAASAPQEGAPLGPDGVIYPGTCRPDPAIQMELGQTQRPQNTALRLNMGRALGRKEMSVTPNFLVESIGDVVVARRDMGTSYHLSVVVDDAAQNITHVVRGADLAEATPIHVLLQSLLGLPKPVYHHHKLIRDDQGKRLAKRDDARAISTYSQKVRRQTTSGILWVLVRQRDLFAIPDFCKEARAPTGVAGSPFLDDLHQDTITVAIYPEINERLGMTAGCPFDPKFLS